MMSRSEPKLKPVWQILLCLLFLCLELTSVTGLRKLHRAPNDCRVVGSYYVHINRKANWSSVEELISNLQRIDCDPNQPDFKAHVENRFTQAGYGFSATLSNAALQMVLDQKTVLFVEEDQYVQGGQARTVVTWGLDRIDQASNARDSRFNVPCNLTGKGVDVYILDTGISERHIQLRGKVQTLTCGAYHKQNVSCFAHGTHIAGTIGGTSFGVAPGVNIFSVQILNCTNQGTWNTILQGIECVLNHTQHRGNQSAVVNMSIFGTKHRAIKKGIDRLIKRGITVVGIVGNSNITPKDSCKTFPASVQGVIGVSASTRLDEAYRYSNAGVCVDLYAPGEGIISASHSCEFCRDTRSGSSMAAPHVTGAIALLLERCPNLPPWKVHYHLLAHMTIPDKLNMRTIPKRLRRSTPNLLLHVSDAMCTLKC